MNRLQRETSPYLRQHRENPVDWFPWGDEAFAEARRRDRPILLSVGYSACHWCHVMAHESFEDEATAALMNGRFVNVKVDREERPDVDSIYMDAVQAMTGRGGWPMTVFLTPDGRPFHAGTYYPPRRRGAMPSFTEVMDAVDDAWRHRRDELGAQADRLTGAVGRTLAATGGALPGLDTLDRAASISRDGFDPESGGFGPAPKFPASMTLDALLLVHRRTGDPEIARIVTTSLDAMASGGIYDHLGGGFARYSVDDRWLIPHFEKMLYDNALLVRVYLHAWQATGDARYLQVVEETIEYVLDDLALPGGGFASARDADSEGVEGRFYGWSAEEMTEVVGDAGVDPERAITWWGVTDEGNFAEAGRDRPNILHRPVRGDLLRPPEIETARAALALRRRERVAPGLDDKVLTEWNGLMLSALAEAAAATGEPRWRDAAVTTADFLLAGLRRADGRWLRSWQAPDAAGVGGARHLAYAHDHAAMIDALTRLAELTGEARWVGAARETADALLELFTDHDNGGFFTTGVDAEALLVRPKDLMDNATPSAQSAAAIALLRLHALVGDGRYLDAAEAVLGLLGEVAGANPIAFGNLLVAVDLHSFGVAELAIVGPRADLVDVAREQWRPHLVLAHGEPYPSPLWDGRVDGLAYVCQAFTCRTPTGDGAELRALLDEADPGPAVVQPAR